MMTDETLDEIMVDLEDITGEKLEWSTTPHYVILEHSTLCIIRDALKELWEHDRIGG